MAFSASNTPNCFPPESKEALLLESVRGSLPHQDILNPEVQRNDFNVYRSSTFGQARITKAGTSWKWEERSQGPFHGLTSGKQNFIVCFWDLFLKLFLKFSLRQLWVFFFFCRAPWDGLRNFLACFLFSFLYGFFFRRVLRKNFALRYLDSVKPFSFVWPSPIFF